MDIIIVTGMSGAGKSKCLKLLEDLGCLCMDNIMPQLIENVVDACERNRETMAVDKLVISVDVRGGIFFSGTLDEINKLRAKGRNCRVIFMDASDEALVNRYKESRREHPLAVGGRVINGIQRERETLTKLKDAADVYIDTSHLSTLALKQKLVDLIPARGSALPAVIVVTFGQKRGIPMDCDMVYDLRFLPNPYHDENLRSHNGKEKCVKDYVFADTNADAFVVSVVNQIEMILPSYITGVKPTLIVGIGCTGGKHRSVAFAEELVRVLRGKGLAVALEHRDWDKE